MSRYNEFYFYIEGKEYQKEFLDLIANAHESICLQTYIFRLDNFGTKVYKSLIAKAKEGVSVDLVIDYIGSYYLDPELTKKLSGVKNFKITFFNPISAPKILQIGRRLHHKILIIDKTIAIIGGINITDGKNSGPQNIERLDFAVKIKSDIVEDLNNYCSQISQIVTRGTADVPLPRITIHKDAPILFHYNDWMSNRKNITSRYLNLIKKSTKSIYLIHGYFFPSFRIINKLIKKSREGVKVHLVLPKHSDWQSWVWATEYLYSKLIKNGVKIFEWERSAIHGKLTIFDEEIILVGSYNLNYTSSYGNLEMNVEIKSQDFVRNIMKKEMNYILGNSAKVSQTTLSNWSWISKFRNIFYYLALLAVSTFSINWIKASRHVKNMTFMEKFFFMGLIGVGLLGLILPILPSFPFFLGAMVLMMKKRDDY